MRGHHFHDSRRLWWLRLLHDYVLKESDTVASVLGLCACVVRGRVLLGASSRVRRLVDVAGIRWLSILIRLFIKVRSGESLDPFLEARSRATSISILRRKLEITRFSGSVMLDLLVRRSRVRGGDSAY